MSREETQKMRGTQYSIIQEFGKDIHQKALNFVSELYVIGEPILALGCIYARFVSLICRLFPWLFP